MGIKTWFEKKKMEWFAVRQLDWNELIILLYCSSNWFLIMLAPEFYTIVTARYDDETYASYIEMMARYGGEPFLSWVSLVLALLYTSLFFVKKYNYRIVISAAGLIYYSVIGISYILSYPNMMAGLIIPVGAWLWSEIFRLINEDAELKKIARVEAQENQIGLKGGE